MNIRMICLVLCIGIVAVAGNSGCIHTEPFTDQEGRILPGSVATMEMAPIEDVRPLALSSSF